MALILAIEPDRKQAGQLTAMVRGRLHAELVLGDSAERALESLGQRIPDLVLTSALLSPKDETALGERLRALDGAAAHVQTLTIPVLASPARSAASRAGGVLAALRRDKGKSASAPDGCDPAVFAEQCKEYLERAEVERAAILEQAATTIIVREPTRAPVAPSPVTGAEWTVVREESRDTGSRAADVADELREFIADGGTPADSEPAAAAQEPFEAAAPRYQSERAPIYDPGRAPIYDPGRAPIYTPPSAADAASAFMAAPEPEAVAAVDQAAVVEPPPAEVPAAPAAPARRDRTRRSFLGLNDDTDGPASLLAAVAAFEAEAQPAVVVEEPAYASAAAQAPAAVEAVEPDADAAQDFDLSALLQRAAPAPSGKRVAGHVDEDAVYELDPSLVMNPTELSPIDLSAEIANEESRLAAAVAEPAAPRSETRSWPILEDLVQGWPARLAEPAAEAAAPADAPDDLHEWADIVEALKRDAEQLQPPPAKEPVVEVAPVPLDVDVLEPVQIAPPPPPEPEPEPAKAEASNGKRKKKKSRVNPAQDEWGFFDPEQCGFAALIHKLEEITDPDDPPTPRRA